MVFLLAGGAKLASPTWPDQARALGAPTAVARLLPFVEASVGAVLVTGLARRLVAVIAAVLLAAFTIAVVVQLAQGRRPPCACFGGRTARPIGPWTLVRNAAFLAVAVVAIAA